jgi:hypothetical protein
MKEAAAAFSTFFSYHKVEEVGYRVNSLIALSFVMHIE